jgi:hypothetical protein
MEICVYVASSLPLFVESASFGANVVVLAMSDDFEQVGKHG